MGGMIWKRICAKSKCTSSKKQILFGFWKQCGEVYIFEFSILLCVGAKLKEDAKFNKNLVAVWHLLKVDFC